MVRAPPSADGEKIESEQVATSEFSRDRRAAWIGLPIVRRIMI